MNTERRRFTFGAALMLALILESPKIALAITKTHRSKRNELTDAAFDFLTDYKFSHAEKMVLFGLDDVHKIEDDEHLRNYLGNGSEEHTRYDFWDRIRHIIIIRKEMDILHGENLSTQLAWMDTENVIFPRKSLRAHMLGGSILELSRAVTLLETSNIS